MTKYLTKFDTEIGKLYSLLFPLQLDKHNNVSGQNISACKKSSHSFRLTTTNGRKCLNGKNFRSNATNLPTIHITGGTEKTGPLLETLY